MRLLLRNADSLTLPHADHFPRAADDEGFEPVLPPGAEPQFDDEVDKTLLEEPSEAPVTGPAAPGVFKPKHAVKEKKRAEEAESAAQRQDEGPSDPAARKLWLEERQKAADLALAMDALGVSAPAPVLPSAPKANAPTVAVSSPSAGRSAAAAGTGAAAPAGSLAAATAGLALSDADSFRVAGGRVGLCVAEAVAAKAGGPTGALTFAKELLTALSDRMSPEDLITLRTLADSLRNKKLQSAKVAPVKKPAVAGKKGAKLRIEADDDYMSHGVGATADDYADMGDSGAGGAAKSSSGAAARSWDVADDFM